MRQKQLFPDVLQNRCSLKVRHIHRITTVQKSLFNKAAGLKAFNFIKKRLQHSCFSVNIAKSLNTAFFIENIWWQLLIRLGFKGIALVSLMLTLHFS